MPRAAEISIARPSGLEEEQRSRGVCARYLGVNAEAKPACGGGRRLKPPVKDTAVAHGCYVSARRANRTDDRTLIAAGKLLTRVSRHATLPSRTARHGKMKRTGTDLEAGNHAQRLRWF